MVADRRSPTGVIEPRYTEVVCGPRCFGMLLLVGLGLIFRFESLHMV